jgi:hypothetical protein
VHVGAEVVECPGGVVGVEGEDLFVDGLGGAVEGGGRGTGGEGADPFQRAK